MRPLVDREIARISPYEPGKPLGELERELGSAWPKEGAIKLASNENPLGASPRALEAARLALGSVHLYPDGSAHALRERLASGLAVSPGQLLIGSGSNELIDLLVQTFCATDEEVLFPACSFACYRLSAQTHRRPFRETQNGSGFAYDLEALCAAVGPRTKLVFLANPNNPTGVYAGKEALRRLAATLPADVLLAVDEAYFEYARAADYPDALTLLGERERMVVLRTFSKIHGLAGLRVGYAVAPPPIIDYLNRVRMPFNVNAVAQAAACAALDDTEHAARSRRGNAEQIEVLVAGLRALGLLVEPSQGNFVLVDLGARSGQAVFGAMLQRGVIVRPLLPYGLPHHLRITVGTAAQNARLLTTIGEVLR